MIDGLFEIAGFDGDIHLIFEISTGDSPVDFTVSGDVVNQSVNQPLTSVGGGSSARYSTLIEPNILYG